MKLFRVALPKVILPLMISGLFFISAIAAIGRPQFATGPQKCCADANNGEKKQQHTCGYFTHRKEVENKSLNR